MQEQSTVRKDPTAIGVKLLVLFVAIGACYSYFDAIGPILQYGESYAWSRPANIHDHFVYFDWALHSDIRQLAAGDNNFGISWLFLTLIDRYNEFEIFVLNQIFMVIGYFYYAKIASHFCLKPYAYIAFLLNTFLLYFSLLINKDMATFMIIMAAGWYTLQNSRAKLLLLLPFAFLVRQQMALFIVTIFFLEYPLLSYRLKILVTFIISSILAIILLRTFDFIDPRTLAEGITGRLSAFFLEEQYLAPLGVPIRLLLYIFDYSISLNPVILGYTDALKALRIPSIIFFILFSFSLLKAISNPLQYIDFQKYRPLVSVLMAFLAALLINPQINARYLTCLVPFMILLTIIITQKVPYKVYMMRLQKRFTLSGYKGH